ncbi:SUMF1/EgtB/PvdO family nonheme iron enzyme [Pinisolibacter aquiterrae]|uniref:SUMF1/EgtB/PvdO family nonheme iron enzyme n=1 Tax=Pinisolibacter aquiterrae TaxID=2815579 RepID=UPI001E290B16|nr:SUMF1/EgtB/PvdO family nonheme iron enzyme [Pinisolibacter aquiterrae]MCC8235983.1 SUMF1/EgtB/PvdO family nonheme iron enzyme [Pinisolibacter aquiterrae]
MSGLDDARLEEAEALLARPMDQAALAADETRAAYETALTRLGTAVASLGAVKTEVDALRAEQSERRDAVVKAGGEASNAYAALEAAFETGAKAYDGRDWVGARAGYVEARRLIDVIRKEIDDKSILACPDPHGQHGSRLVRAGTYPAGTMSLAGRVAEDAQRVTRTPRSNAFVAIGTPFCVMLQQVTAGDYQAYVRDRHPPTFEHLRARLENPAQPSDPVVDVSKLDAEGFIAWLKERDGRTYILPTLDQVIATIAKGVQERIPELPNGVSDPYREWTRELCNNGEGVLVVGRVGSEDNRTYVQCLRPSERFDNIGFRLLVVR